MRDPDYAATACPVNVGSTDNLRVCRSCPATMEVFQPSSRARRLRGRWLVAIALVAAIIALLATGHGSAAAPILARF